MSWKKEDMAATAIAAEEVKKKRYQDALMAYYEGRKEGKKRTFLAKNLKTQPSIPRII